MKPADGRAQGFLLKIRGVSTCDRNYQPLYVIDGVQIRPNLPTGGAYNIPVSYGNVLSGINAEDIENISVLEDTATTEAL